MLVEAGIKFEYEPYAIELMPAFTALSVSSFEKYRKNFVPKKPKIQSISYTPDFVGHNWIIETKGIRTPDFNIKWKLLKHYFFLKGQKVLLLMPSNKKEIGISIELIKYVRKRKF